MLRVRVLLALAATVALVSVSTAQRQPRPAVTPTPLAVVLLPGIDNSEWDAAMTAYLASGDKAALLQSLLTITP